MRTRKSAFNLFTAMFGQAICLFVSILSRIIFTHYMSQEYLGLSGLFTNILTMLSLVELGVGPAITFALYKPLAEGDKETIKSLMRLYSRAYHIIGCIVLVIGIVFTPIYPYLIKDTTNISNLDIIYLLYVLNTGISYFFSYKITLITADQRQYIRNIGHYSFFAIMNISQSLLLIITRNYIIYLIAQVIFTLIENYTFSNIADRLYPYLREKSVKRLSDEQHRLVMRNVKTMIFHKIGSLVVGSTDNILISKVLGLAISGVYSNYSLILNALNTILAKVYDSVVASVGNLNASGDIEHLYNVYQRLFFLSFCLYGFCASCIACLIQPFISLAFGEKYLLDELTVAALIGSFYTSGMRHAPNVIRSAAGLYYRDWPKPIAESFVNLIASIVLMKQFGVAGVFLGTIASTVLVTAWVEALVVYRYALYKKFIIFIVDYSKYLISTLIIIYFNIKACSIITLNGVFGILFKGIANILIFVIFLRIFYRNNENLRYFLNLGESFVCMLRDRD